MYYPGSTVTIPGLFKVAGVLTDPSTVTLKIRVPSGTTTSYLLGGPGSPVVRDAIGTYHANIVAAAAGHHSWEWVGTGDVAAVDVGDFYVEQPITAPRLISRDDVKTARRGMPDVLDDLIDTEIVRATAAITTYAKGRKFVADATATTRIFPVKGDAVFCDDLAAAPATGAVKIWTPFGTAAAATLVAGTDYILSPRNREAWEPITGLDLAQSWSSDYEARIEGRWGFPAIPEDIREACIETVVEWLKGEQSLTISSPDQFEPGSPPERGMPLKARDLVRPFRRVLVAWG